MAVAMKTFLPGIGFRRAGTRLLTPVSVIQSERTLTVLRLIATPEATDLVYEVTHLPNDASMGGPGGPSGMDRVFLSDGASEYRQGGAMNIAVRAGKLVRTFAMVPMPEDTTHIELRVSGPSIGEWAVPLELVPFPGPSDPTYVDVGASDSRHGITVTVRGMAAGANETALDLIALADAAEIRIWGLGGMGMRNESTALTLRDDKGRSWVEHFRQDARDQFPDPTGIADVAIFDALPADASKLTLEIPSVCFDDTRPSLDVELPVESPRDARLGTYPVRILASRSGLVTRGPRSMPAVTLDVDLGTEDDETCVIKPAAVEGDGRMWGMGYGGQGIHGPSPRPVRTVEIFYQADAAPQRVTLKGATIRARGPWRISFDRPS
jgi:hypothetical protein